MSKISPLDLQRAIANDPNLTLLDVRTPLEFDEVHVAQARNEPLDELNPHLLGVAGIISSDRPIYLLCRSGARATKAAAQLSAAGYEKSVVVEGGTLAWIEAGLPVERGAVKVVSLERQVRIAAGSLVLVGFLLSRFVHPWFIYLSAFVGAGLVFAGVTDWCGMGLLLAKAPWNTRKPLQAGS